MHGKNAKLPIESVTEKQTTSYRYLLKAKFITFSNFLVHEVGRGRVALERSLEIAEV